MRLSRFSILPLHIISFPNSCLEKKSFLRTRLRHFLAPLLLLTGLPAYADPLWWSQAGADGHAVINSAVTQADPKAVANIGQAKFMAKRALEALRPIMSQTADSIEAALVGPGKIIPSWTPPVPSTPLAEAQFAPLRVGQLKAIADPFYTALREADSEWVLTQLSANGTMDLANPENFFPWTSAPEDNADKAIATIGQLKAVFSLRFETIPQALGAEDVGIPDEDVVDESESGGGGMQFALARGAQGGPTPASLGYIMQYRKGVTSQKKYGYASFDNPESSKRYLSKFRAINFTEGSSLAKNTSSEWVVGHWNRINFNSWYGHKVAVIDYSNLNQGTIKVSETDGEEEYDSGFVDFNWARLPTWQWQSEKTRGKWDPQPQYWDENILRWSYLEYDRPPYNFNRVNPWNINNLVEWNWYDGPAKIFYEEVLSDENTIAEVEQLALANPPDYPSQWKNGIPSARYEVWENKLGVTYSRLKFRFVERSGVNITDPVSVGVYFKRKSDNVTSLVKTVSWKKGNNKASSDCVIDPKVLKPGIEGVFHVGLATISFELDIAQQKQRAQELPIIIPTAIPADEDGEGLIATPEISFPGMDNDTWFTGASITLSKVSGTGSLQFKAVHPSNGTEVLIPLDTNLASDFFKSTGIYHGYKWKVVGITPGSVVVRINYSKGTTTNMWAKRSAVVAPLEVNSLDKYVDVKIPAAAVDALGGIDKFSLRLAKKNGESYEIALKNAYIYERSGGVQNYEGVFFPTSEAAALQINQRSYDEGVAPIAVSKENGFYRFVTCFNQLGRIKIELKKDGVAAFSQDYTLLENNDMAELIDRLQTIFSESFMYRNAGGYFPGGGDPGVIAMMAQIPLSAGGVTGPQALGFWASITNRNLVAKCCSAVFDVVKDSVKKGVVLAAEGVKIAVVGAQGFCQGLWSGVKSDAASVGDFATMLIHPIDTGKSFYEGFRKLCSMSLEQLKGIPRKMLEEYLTDAQKSIGWAEPSGIDLVIYTVGYSAGYLAEQVLVSIIKTVFVAPAAIAGLATTGAKIAKMMDSFKAGAKILGAVQSGKDVVAKVQKAKNLAVKSCTQFISDKTGLDKIEAIVQRTLTSGCPVSP